MFNKDSQVAPALLPSLEKLFPPSAESGTPGMLGNAQSLSTEAVKEALKLPHRVNCEHLIQLLHFKQG